MTRAENLKTTETLTAKTPARRSSAKKTSKKLPGPSRTLPLLDATQQSLIAKLASSLESWQSFGQYEPERALENPTIRRAAGAKLLKSVPHAAHAEWTPPKNRPNPADIVIAGNAGRQEDYVPLRMGRMAASPFAFLRGAAAVMAWDLSHTPVTGMQVIIDGDAHINNFGLYVHRSATSSWTSTTSMKRPSARGNGTSSGWSQA